MSIIGHELNSDKSNTDSEHLFCSYLFWKLNVTGGPYIQGVVTIQCLQYPNPFTTIVIESKN